MVEGYIVGALQSMPMPPKEVDLGTVAPPDCVADPRAARWAHVGMMYVSPWRPTFQWLTPLENDGEIEGAVKLECTCDFARFYLSFEDADQGACSVGQGSRRPGDSAACA